MAGREREGCAARGENVSAEPASSSIFDRRCPGRGREKRGNHVLKDKIDRDGETDTEIPGEILIYLIYRYSQIVHLYIAHALHAELRPIQQRSRPATSTAPMRVTLHTAYRTVRRSTRGVSPLASARPPARPPARPARPPAPPARPPQPEGKPEGKPEAPGGQRRSRIQLAADRRDLHAEDGRRVARLAQVRACGLHAWHKLGLAGCTPGTS